MNKIISLIFIFFCSIEFTFAEENEFYLSAEKIEIISFSEKSPNKLFFKLRNKTKKGEKATAAVLAFPLPFGVLGLHRIYLGTKPYVPIVYIGSVGGCFGILPFIDFTMILLDKDLEKFKSNNKVFMWVK